MSGALYVDFKYGSSDWREDREETFRKTQQVRTQYTVVDGQVVRTVETTTSYASALSAVGTDPTVGPPWFYADKTYRADPAYKFQDTRIVTTTYEELSGDSYQVTIDDFDVLAGTHTITHKIIDGKIPLAPTKGSSLTNLLLRPVVVQYIQTCDFVENSTSIDLQYAETEDEMSAAVRRQRQRDTAVVRELDIPANPFIRAGHTVRLIDAGRSIDKRVIVVGGKVTHSADTARATTHLVTEDWQK
jgi:hypothetical protein